MAVVEVSVCYDWARLADVFEMRIWSAGIIPGSPCVVFRLYEQCWTTPVSPF